MSGSQGKGQGPPPPPNAILLLDGGLLSPHLPLLGFGGKVCEHLPSCPESLTKLHILEIA